MSLGSCDTKAQANSCETGSGCHGACLTRPHTQKRAASGALNDSAARCQTRVRSGSPRVRIDPEDNSAKTETAALLW